MPTGVSRARFDDPLTVSIATDLGWNPASVSKREGCRRWVGSGEGRVSTDPSRIGRVLSLLSPSVRLGTFKADSTTVARPLRVGHCIFASFWWIWRDGESKGA